MGQMATLQTDVVTNSANVKEDIFHTKEGKDKHTHPPLSAPFPGKVPGQLCNWAAKASLVFRDLWKESKATFFCLLSIFLVKTHVCLNYLNGFLGFCLSLTVSLTEIQKETEWECPTDSQMTVEISVKNKEVLEVFLLMADEFIFTMAVHHSKAPSAAINSSKTIYHLINIQLPTFSEGSADVLPKL